ncbi:MAG: potassium channel family protein [Propioniciclava sp.]|uniref:potassium channel family protein n=1 Tax=Propioniciclava sp. TaxID=2038686 RepID=UPI0039E53B98
MSPESHQRRPALRRRDVEVPRVAPSTDALFLVLRRMRAPLVVIVVVFTVSVAGLCLIPGVDEQGLPARMSVFDAFYFMAYTATTIGFGEVPYPLTREQRMWVIACIFASVIGWAYAIGSLLALVQDRAFRGAIARQAFVRRVRRLRRPFLILVGYGQMGRAVAETLDALGRSCVVVASSQESIDALAGAQLSSDIPGLAGDASDPGILGLAGLGSRYCTGVLALTDDDAANLSIVMAVTLLRPDVQVIAHANRAETDKAMREFGADSVVNPFERYGNYLVTRLRRPSTHRLVTWLTAAPGDPVGPVAEPCPDGHWIIAADDHFGEEIAADLEDAGLPCSRVWPVDGAPDVSGAAGFIAAGLDDAENLAMAGHARLSNPDAFLVVRQKTRRNDALLRAFEPDSVFVAAHLSVQEALARVITPDFWDFVQYAWDLSDADGAALLDRIVRVVGTESPDSRRFVIGEADTPAVARWLRTREAALGDLFRYADDRDGYIQALPVLLIRDGQPRYMPEFAKPVRPGDVVVAVGRPRAFHTMVDALHYDHTLEYLVTGASVPATWVWRLLRRRARSRTEA